jgi:hypothetical protein
MTEYTDATASGTKSRIARYRRLVVDRVYEHTTLTVADLADEIAAHEHDVPLDEVDPMDVTDVYFELCERHLPQLVRASFVTYDEEHDLVSRPGYGPDSVVTVSDVELPAPDETDSA